MDIEDNVVDEKKAKGKHFLLPIPSSTFAMTGAQVLDRLYYCLGVARSLSQLRESAGALPRVTTVYTSVTTGKLATRLTSYSLGSSNEKEKKRQHQSTTRLPKSVLLNALTVSKAMELYTVERNKRANEDNHSQGCIFSTRVFARGYPMVQLSSADLEGTDVYEQYFRNSDWGVYQIMIFNTSFFLIFHSKSKGPG